MTTKLKILLVLNFILLVICRFLIPLFMLYKMYGANITDFMFYIVAGLLSMWLGPKIGGILLITSLNEDEKKWLAKELLISELKNKLGI